VQNLLIKQKYRQAVDIYTNEDFLAGYVKKHLKRSINKVENRWEGEDYEMILEQVEFHDFNKKELIQAKTGSIHAALDRSQFHFMTSKIPIIRYSRSSILHIL
jgi:hypothetical protein